MTWLLKKGPLCCACRRIFTKIRYLAFVERRSVNGQIEHALYKYIKDYEKRYGPIQIPEPNEEEE